MSQLAKQTRKAYKQVKSGKVFTPWPESQPDRQNTYGKNDMQFQPRIGDWYQSINGDKFEIVAIDEDESTLEVQYYDGAVEEIDFDSWEEMEIASIEPPEDWSGSLDLEREDYGVDLELTSPNDHLNPFDNID